MGPAVSCDEEIGTILITTNPTVGLNPTIPLIDAGQDCPFVSVPMLTFTIPDAITADPELEPQGLNFLPNG